MSVIVPAVLPASRADLKEKLALLSQIHQVTRIQIDVVDGVFATPACWPYTAPEELHDMLERREILPDLDRIEYEIDLMCVDALAAAAAWLTLGATRLTIHAESVADAPELLASLHKRYGSDVVYGLALNIESDLALTEPCLADIGYVQFMGIAQIGRQGQSFDKRVLEKIHAFRAQHPELPVQVDGGITLQNAGELASMGVANLIVGSAILRSDNPYAEVAKLEAAQSAFGV